MSERKRVSASGREALVSLFAIGSIMDVFNGRFEHLCKRIPNGWRDFRMVQSRLTAILDKILETIPVDQLKAIKAQMQLTSIHVATKRVAGKPQDYWVISYDDLADLAEYATKTECIACNGKNGPCRLRDILRELPIQGVERLVVGCWEGDE